MAIPEETREYLEGQIGHYIEEAASYRQLAGEYAPGASSPEDAALGMVAGCVYSAFLQACGGQGGPSLEDVRELGAMLRDRAPLIRAALAGRPPPPDAGPR